MSHLISSQFYSLNPLGSTCTELVLSVIYTLHHYKNATGGVPDNSTGLLKITSTRYSNLKPLDFTTGGTTFSLVCECVDLATPTEHVHQRHFQGHLPNCQRHQCSPGNRCLEFINGYFFLERFYSVYDSSDGSIGFAINPVHHGHNQLNGIIRGGGRCNRYASSGLGDRLCIIGIVEPYNLIRVLQGSIRPASTLV